jgi:hypothetical protein
LIVPHYKYFDSSPLLINESSEQWYYIVNADISLKIKTEYSKVKHLETIGATGASLVATKIAMSLFKDENKKNDDYFALNEFYEKVYFEQVMTIPAYYRQPKNIQGKVLSI